MHDSNIVYVSNENKYIPSIFLRRYAITMMNLTHCKVKIIISPKEKYLLHFKKILESKDHCIERDALRIYNCLVYDIREVDCRFDANKKTTDVKKRNQFISNIRKQSKKPAQPAPATPETSDTKSDSDTEK